MIAGPALLVICTADLQIFRAIEHPDQELFNLWEPQVKLDEACNWRCARRTS